MRANVTDLGRVRYLAVLAAALCWGPAVLGQLAPGMDGRANDSNNRVGSGGRNTPVQQTYFNTANLFVTGNVTGGRAFQGVSPIRDPSSLFVSVPTAALGTFQRDTVGLPQVTGYQSPAYANPYYNPALTVSGAGAISAGLNSPGSSLPASPYQIPQGGFASPFGGAGPNVNYGYHAFDPAVPSSSIYSPNNYPLVGELYPSLVEQSELDALRGSPVFGRTSVQTTSLRPLGQGAGGALSDPYGAAANIYDRRSVAPISIGSRATTEADGGPSSEQMLGASRALLSPTSVAPRLFMNDAGAAARDALTGRPLPEAPAHWAGIATGTSDPSISRGEVRDLLAWSAGTITPRPGPGNVAISYAPVVSGEGGVDEMAVNTAAPAWSGPSAETGGAASEAGEGSASAGLPMSDVKAETIEESADRRHARVEELTAEADGFLREGDYYKAANRYSLAAAFDASDAGVRLGYGHALLAAGEYLSAVQQLTEGIGLIDNVRFLRTDLSEIIPDVHILDIRRADLESRLEQRDDYRLRFLLGYTEYYSGLPQFGLPDLKQAAQEAPAGSVIARFPAMLSGEAAGGAGSVNQNR